MTAFHPRALFIVALGLRKRFIKTESSSVTREVKSVEYVADNQLAPGIINDNVLTIRRLTR